MDQETSAWADINPTTALAHRPAPPSQSLAPWNDPNLALKPAGRSEFRRELTACLALVAPSGMHEDARREWLTIAWGTLNELPADLLERGCRAAREKCDHPAKIVPAILAEVKDAWEARKRHRLSSIESRLPAPEPEKIDVCTPEAAAEILAEMGISSAGAETAKQYLGTPRKPTRADYIALGVDPAVLDELSSDNNHIPASGAA